MAVSPTAEPRPQTLTRVLDCLLTIIFGRAGEGDWLNLPKPASGVWGKCVLKLAAANGTSVSTHHQKVKALRARCSPRHQFGTPAAIATR